MARAGRISPHFQQLASFVDPMEDLSRKLEPFRLERELRRLSPSDLLEFFQSTFFLGTRAWIASALAVGVIYDRVTKNGETDAYGFLSRASRDFELPVGTVRRFLRIYSEIIKPKLALEGPNVEFILPQRGFYEAALDVADETGVPAIEVLQIAEEQRCVNPKYSVHRFRSEVGVPKNSRKKVRTSLQDQMVRVLSFGRKAIVEEEASTKKETATLRRFVRELGIVAVDEEKALRSFLDRHYDDSEEAKILLDLANRLESGGQPIPRDHMISPRKGMRDVEDVHRQDLRGKLNIEVAKDLTDEEFVVAKGETKH